MNNGSRDPRPEWDPLGWEFEDSLEESPHLPIPRAGEVVVGVTVDEGPPHRPRTPMMTMLVVSIVLAMVGLVGIGIGVGSLVFNQDPPPTEVVLVTGPTVVSAPATQPLPTQTSAPAPQLAPDMPSPGTPGSEVPAVPADPVVEVARSVIPSVVLIEVTEYGDGVDVPDLGLELPENLDPDQTVLAQGSGIIYDASGLILTNAHVVEGAQALRVQFPDGTRAEGKVVGTASAIDVALVRADTDMSLTPAVFAELATVEVGQLAVAIGSPFGLQQSVTSGIVSAVGRPIREGQGAGAFVEMIQTDAPINPGNSGGALANRFGQVIGMNTLIRTDGSFGNIGLGFAIPSDIALNIAQRILNGESTELGYMGIWGTEPAIGLPGALVERVEEGSPADEAGLMVGDLIVHIDGEAVSTMAELAAKVQFRVPGTEVVVEVVRDDVRLQLTMVVGSRPSGG